MRRKRSLSQGRRKPDLRVARRYGHDTGRGTSSPRREYPALGRHGDAACGGLRAASAMPESRVAPNVAIYHGSVGAFAHIACESAFPDARSIAGDSLLDVVDAVRSGAADVAVLPCENVLAGRVPDIHMLLPEAGLSIVGEIFLPIELHLVAPEGWSLAEIRRVHSHPVALRQVQRFLRSNGLFAVAQSDTATAAALIKQKGDRADAAIASNLAAQTYGLQVLKPNIQDDPFNMTRFYVLAAKPIVPAADRPDVLTCLMFEVRNTPGALFRAVGGFAENGINLTRLESYLVGGQFVATRFLCEFEGHPDGPPVRRALHTLRHFTTSQTIMGVFPMHSAGSRTRADRDLPTNERRSKPGLSRCQP
ncbi:prephenate dehydratase domain-containing protein [Oceaniradius stylonematis]|uniref:prephenate dehydratase domain-containing protein n=1 Tax=Oceaniradius stylonematis TaxID=2184161 RepID=UPI0027402737|nr:prephenate dehydratase domain-containing protein [Oceaniradius stylonematis]